MTDEPAGPLTTWTTVAPLKTELMTVGPIATPTNPTEGPTNVSGTPLKAGKLNAGSEPNVGRWNPAKAAGVVAALAPPIGAATASAPRTPASAPTVLFFARI